MPTVVRVAAIWVDSSDIPNGRIRHTLVTGPVVYRPWRTSWRNFDHGVEAKKDPKADETYAIDKLERRQSAVSTDDVWKIISGINREIPEIVMGGQSILHLKRWNIKTPHAIIIAKTFACSCDVVTSTKTPTGSIMLTLNGIKHWFMIMTPRPGAMGIMSTTWWDEVWRWCCKRRRTSKRWWRPLRRRRRRRWRKICATEYDVDVGS